MHLDGAIVDSIEWRTDGRVSLAVRIAGRLVRLSLPPADAMELHGIVVGYLAQREPAGGSSNKQLSIERSVTNERDRRQPG
jgi:hypothetical protein